MPLQGKIELYIKDHSKPESYRLQCISNETKTSTLPQMSVGHVEGKLLAMLVSITNAKKILEIGTFTGYSALAMAEATSKDATIVSVQATTHFNFYQRMSS